MLISKEAQVLTNTLWLAQTELDTDSLVVKRVIFWHQ